MLWVDDDSYGRLPSAQVLQLARARTDRSPDSADAHVALGDEWIERHCWPEAVAAYSRALALDPGNAGARVALAIALTRAGSEREALELLGEADARAKQGVGAMSARCEALRGLERMQEAAEQARLLLAKYGNAFRAAELLLTEVASRGDGEALLKACDELPSPLSATAVEFAFRALALSLLGRVEEARAIVDLDRQLLQYRFEPPTEFKSIEAFNATLAAEVLEQIGTEELQGDAWKTRHVKLSRLGAPAYCVLLDWLRPVFEAHIERCRAGNADRLLAALPERAQIYTETFVCRHDGHNGVHMHRRAILAGVYHLAVPSDLQSGRGELIVGLPPKGADGHSPAWRQRRVSPVPGTLTLFPAYVFHDFVPTASDGLRIAIGLGVRPA